ncbi:MAG: hypothetical protein JWM34_2152 [Ilumatobacteraceae bacterium]|nr:hypothetical protein [Ilumatobacteraceae bacterium]
MGRLSWNTPHMKTSPPADLAVAFRSLQRRLDDVSADAPAADVSRAQEAIDHAIASAAGRLGSAKTAGDVAAAISARPADQWTDADLAAIQRDADGAARAIRTIADLVDQR